MARIRSAWEIALEKTKDIEIDEQKYRTDSLEKAGMALAGTYLNNTDTVLDEIAAKYASYSEEDRAVVRRGMAGTVISNISLPQDDGFAQRFSRICDLADLISGSDPQVSGLMQ